MELKYLAFIQRHCLELQFHLMSAKNMPIVCLDTIFCKPQRCNYCTKTWLYHAIIRHILLILHNFHTFPHLKQNDGLYTNMIF